MQLRRAGQVWSKMRFASAQLIAYVENRLWLDMARASNAIAARIAAGLRDLPGARLLAPVEVNEIFLELPSTTMDALETDGFQFYRRSRSLAPFCLPLRDDRGRGRRARGSAAPPPCSGGAAARSRIPCCTSNVAAGSLFALPRVLRGASKPWVSGSISVGL